MENRWTNRKDGEQQGMKEVINKKDGNEKGVRTKMNGDLG
jgi:hypothetical protein